MKIKRWSITAAIIIWSLLSAGCSQYQFHSNLDRAPIAEYFSVTEVVVYQEEELASRHYRYLDTVEGESCQQETDQPPANNADARTNARKKAAALGANGIVFLECVAIAADETNCISTRLCYGKALKLYPQSTEH